jgi:choline dehydrogenase-like flavoprotein
MKKLHRASFLIALQVDGILEGDEGGRVSITSTGRLRLSYPTKDYLKESFKASMKACAQLAFAGGAQEVHSLHASPLKMNNPSDIEGLDALKYGALQHGIFSAHQMGGLPMGGDPSNSVVNTHLQHHRIPNLFVVDGSVFPTSLGVNPSHTIYGLAHWVSSTILANI